MVYYRFYCSNIIIFIKFPLWNYKFNIICILIITVWFNIKFIFSKRLFIKEIIKRHPIDEIHNILIYPMPFERLKTHNVMIVKWNPTCIIMEEKIINLLSKEEKKAVLLYEIGHLYTFSNHQIYILNSIAVAFSSIGFHLMYYYSIYFLVVIGVTLVILVVWLKNMWSIQRILMQSIKDVGKRNLFQESQK